MSIFVKPENQEITLGGTLFLHGLEGSTSGSKANHLRQNHEAFVPSLRTKDLRAIRNDSKFKSWSETKKRDIDSALEPALMDAKDAFNYTKPKIIIGSSMGGAILMKLINEGIVDTSKTFCIFLAPAIAELIDPKNETVVKNSMWIFGESDFIIDKKLNLKIAKKSQGNIVFSPEDNHRLSGALKNGLLDSAIVTGKELLEV